MKEGEVEGKSSLSEQQKRKGRSLRFERSKRSGREGRGKYNSYMQ